MSDLVQVRNFVSRERVEDLLRVLDAAVASHRVGNHLGSLTYNYRRFSADEKRVANPVRNAVRALANLVYDGTYYFNYTDLVHRDTGIGMDWHADDVWYPERAYTVVLGLRGDGATEAIDDVGVHHDFEHESGRLVMFPSSWQHRVATPTVPRAAVLMWLTADRSREE